MKTYGMSLFYLTVFTFSIIASPSLTMRKEKETKNSLSNGNQAYPMPNVVHISESVAPKGKCAGANTMNFSNSNSHNQNTKPSLGKTATIVSILLD
jgi:hypothetical protein